MKKMRLSLIIIGICIIVIILFWLICWHPAKYAVREDEFKDYGFYILVKEVHYTGTGWIQIGNESGRFQPDSYRDIYLINGKELPQMEIYDSNYANTFLCKIEERGKIDHIAFEEEIDSFYVTEWYPVYPVLRDSFWPKWMRPQNFMTKSETRSY